MKKLLFLTILSIQFFTASAQLEKPVTWSYYSKKVNAKEAILQIKATINPRWHIYAINQPKESSLGTSFKFSSSKDFILNGTVTEPTAIKKHEKALKMDVFYFENKVVFTQKIKLNKAQTVVKCAVNFMACNDKSCLPEDEVNFAIPVK